MLFWVLLRVYIEQVPLVVIKEMRENANMLLARNEKQLSAENVMSIISNPIFLFILLLNFHLFLGGSVLGSASQSEGCGLKSVVVCSL